MLKPETTIPACPASNVMLTTRFCGLLAALTLTLAMTAAHAVAFGTWKTDDSVCEFGDGAPSLVQKRYFGKPGAPDEKYIEVMVTWIVQNCKNGQLLTMGHNLDRDVARPIFRGVAIEACRAADIRWEDIKTGSGGGITVNGIRMRCPITKFDEMKTRYGGEGDGKKP